MKQARRILYIDDDPGLCRLVQKSLERQGYRVATANTGDEGLALAAAGGFDVIAVDHYMPGQDGLETLTALRKLRDCPPVVYVTGSEESRVAVAALKAGAADYIVKSTGGDFVELLEQSFDTTLAAVRLQQEKLAAEQALKSSNERLQALLREVNHRVANSLQMVSAFVHMQARDVTNEAAREALRDTDSRIKAIAQVHRRLYTSDDVESVAMDEYLAAIVAELQDTWSTPSAPRPIRLQADQLVMKTDHAVSLGVVVNELVSNACKYAYQPEEPGEIRVRLAGKVPSGFRLEIEDDGVGMPAGAKPKGSGLGSKIIHAMARSLSASFAYEASPAGVRAVLQAA
ncbi:response regulator [Sphingomonas sp. KRR8]|uniref:response regulator n=1 Tax=Sphingomonas sp. KRR8 TaxID=2942996 RepID=UPI002021BD18|nr:response regulator [Sphingomonas sp. KRR8]URD59784.1 response regulator [Sphingomonas sp. KRR8]